MIKVQFLCDGKKYPFHWLQHAAVLLTDMETHQSYLINHLPDFLKQNTTTIARAAFSEFNVPCCSESVNLYCNDSSKTIDEFIQQYNAKHPNRRFNYFTNNCADAANEAIEYFFPDVAKKEFNLAYDCLCSLLCIGTLGLKCFAPSCVSLPIDTFDRVKKLEKLYGADDEIKPLKQSMEC